MNMALEFGYSDPALIGGLFESYFYGGCLGVSLFFSLSVYLPLFSFYVGHYFYITLCFFLPNFLYFIISKLFLSSLISFGYCIFIFFVIVSLFFIFVCSIYDNFFILYPSLFTISVTSTSLFLPMFIYSHVTWLVGLIVECWLGCMYRPSPIFSLVTKTHFS